MRVNTAQVCLDHRRGRGFCIFPPDAKGLENLFGESA
jgi:hypothetical protein